MSDISYTQESGTLWVQIKDQFDESNAISIKNEISKNLEEQDSHVLLDLNEVKIIRSSGLRIILLLAKEFNSKNKKFAVLYSKNDENYQVFKILEVSGFLKIVSIYMTKKEALEAFEKGS